MVNEDIITALKNAVEHGESLESAMAVAINSGYNPREVQEAARFVGQGAINMENISRDEVLTMPNKKGFFSNVFSGKKSELQPPQSPKPLKPALKPQQSLKSLYQTQPIQQPQQPPRQSFQQPFQQPATMPQRQTQQYSQTIPMRNLSSQQPQQKQQIKLGIETDYPAKPLTIQLSTPQKKSYIKEIILFVLLLILVAILVITIKFRNEIIMFFS